MTPWAVAVTVVRRSPVAHLAVRLTDAGDSGVSIRELPFLAQVGVRVAAQSPGADAAAGVLGFALPLVPNTTATAGGLTALWLGPDEWLVVGASGTDEALEDDLSRALAGGLGAVVGLSANRTAIELRGPGAREVLAHGCALDLHPRAFSRGRCAQTLVARAQVILEQTSDEPAYRLFVRGSFAGYLAAWLLDAMGESGPVSAESRSSVADRQRSVRSTSLKV